MSLYTHTLAGQEAAAIATLPNFTTDPTREKPKPPGTADVIPTTENASETSTSDAPAAAPTNAPSTPAETAETPNILEKIDTMPTTTDEKTTTKKLPNNQPENLSKNSPATCEQLAECSDGSGRTTVLAENTKKDENIVKVEHFPIKSLQPSSEAKLPFAEFRI